MIDTLLGWGCVGGPKRAARAAELFGAVGGSSATGAEAGVVDRRRRTHRVSRLSDLPIGILCTSVLQRLQSAGSHERGLPRRALGGCCGVYLLGECGLVTEYQLLRGNADGFGVH